MNNSAGQFASSTVADAPPVCVALSRAWQAQALYGPMHATVQQRLLEFCEATKGLKSAVRVYAEPGRLVFAGAALEPSDLFAPLALLLQRSGLSIIEFRGSVELEQARSLMNQLAESRGDAEALALLPKCIAEMTGGAVRVYALSAEHVRIRAASPKAGGQGSDAGQRRITLHELDRRVAQHRVADGMQATEEMALPEAAGQVDQYALDPEVGSVLQLCASSDVVSREAADLECLRVAVAALSPDQRRQLLESLGHDSDVSFEEAAKILSLMPVRDVTDAIAVLERPDARMSSTTLMLLRRLAHLSLGRDVDLERLARVAEGWAADEIELGEEAGVARSTAELLTRLNDTEFRCEEYSELLQELSGDPSDGRNLACALAADDIAQMHQRVVEIVCETLTCPDLEFDASPPLRFLRDRCGVIADLGEVEIVRRVMRVAEGFLVPPHREAEMKAAKALLDAAASERWMARAIAGMADEDQVRDVIDELLATSKPAIDIYVAAVCEARTRMRFLTLVACRDKFGPGDLKFAIARSIASEPRTVSALGPFIHETLPADLIGLLTPALLHPIDDVRRLAFLALERMGVEWRDDLYVRGALDEDEQVRLATIRAIARSDGRHARLLIDRLAGRIGSATCTDVEIEALQIALQSERGGVTTRMALTLCMLSLWPMRVRDGRALAESLRMRPRTPMSVVALTLYLLSPLQIMHRIWHRRKGADHE